MGRFKLGLILFVVLAAAINGYRFNQSNHLFSFGWQRVYWAGFLVVLDSVVMFLLRIDLKRMGFEKLAAMTAIALLPYLLISATVLLSDTYDMDFYRTLGFVHPNMAGASAIAMLPFMKSSKEFVISLISSNLIFSVITFSGMFTL